MTVRARRVIADCRTIATMSEEPGRTTRRFLTEPVREVHDFLRSRMEAMDMAVTIDAVGNLRGLWNPDSTKGKRLMLGSHIDTVPDAGAFDGVLGVVLALELVEAARAAQLPLDLEVIAFSEEEGVRFGLPFIGSHAAAGRFDPSVLALKDDHGISIGQAIEAYGLDPSGIPEAVADPDTIGFLELHIEQGPVLEAENLSIAGVTSIVGSSRFHIKFIGHANHAGTTPMRLRRDALAAAAEWIANVEALANKTEGLVATVGKLEVLPNAGNVIPGLVDLSLDIRHENDKVRQDAMNALQEQAQAIVARRGVELEWPKKLGGNTVAMDERLTAFVTDAMESAGFPPKLMASGAGHDAMVMADRMPTAMLFLRSPGGISHHPEESVREDDVEAALLVGEKLLQRLATEVR